jgi:hypothetical protein
MIISHPTPTFFVQIGYVTPTLRTLGLRDSEVGYAWLAGPLAGLCIQPFVGLYRSVEGKAPLCLLSQKAYWRVLIYVAVHVSCNSDYTTHPWGRRRIYILFGGLLSIAGLIGEYKRST